jgi:Zn-dependent protease
MGSAPAFRLFGFPIHVRVGFLLFIALVVVTNGLELGGWIAGSAAVLILLHELGHAFAARATGAEAEISLDFLAGYASFVPVRPLKPWERAGISLAGPAVQIGVSLAVLFAMGIDPLDRNSYASSAPALAIWWTGPVMGLFNLVPVLPLDGGHVVLAALDRIIPAHSRRLMLWFSIALTVVGGIYLFLHPRYNGFVYFVIFPLLVQIQMLTAGKQQSAAQRSPLARAESMAWTTGDVSAFPDGTLPSPWFRASQQLAQGHPTVARDLVVADFHEPHQPAWWPPDAASTDRLAAVLALLPRPLPTGHLLGEHTLGNVLLQTGAHAEAAHYAAGCFQRTRTTTSALTVARAAAALGDRDVALGWLRAAVEADTDPAGAAHTIDRAPELAAVRADPQVVVLRQRLDG